MAKHMRLPNGFGQITKLKQRLRNPFRAMVTSGQDHEGKYKRLIVGYYKTYNEAYEALIEYHKNPYEKNKDMDFLELYEKWSSEYYGEEHPHAEKMYSYAIRFCEKMYPMKVKDIRTYHIKEMIEESKCPPSTRDKLKSMINLMFDWALTYDLTDKNYSRQVRFSYNREAQTEHHITYTADELKSVYEHMNLEMADALIIACYTGFRPQELMLLETKNIDLDAWTIQGGMKTEAGRDRIVPIHPFIKDLIRKRMETANEKLFSGLNYDAYKNRLVKIREELHLNHKHKPHDTRVTFVTNAKKYNVDEYAIKRIVGHHIDDLTERVYADRDVSWLHEEISKIPGIVDLV